MLDKNMRKTTKLSPTSSIVFDNNSSIATNAQNVLSFRRILYRRPPPTTPQTEQSYVVISSSVNENARDFITRSILMDNAAQQRGFLPHDYRIANTFESIRRQRSQIKSPSKYSTTTPRVSNHSTLRFDAFGNSTNSLSKLAEQRLILREKTNRKKPNSSPFGDKQERTLVASEADFATDIPSALNLIIQNTKEKSSIELNLFEKLRRDRLQTVRYRLLPINRAPNLRST